MEFEGSPSSTSSVNCCNCGRSCLMTHRSYLGTWIRCVKRKFDEIDDKTGFIIPGLDISQVAKVDIENECAALREMVSSQQQTIRDLSVELDEERNASSSAANEAMSMILRLQREKAEIQMEFRQFKRYAEEKMAHDSQEFLVLEDLLYQKEQAIESVTSEIQEYKDRLMSCGFTEAEADGERGDMSQNDYTLENLEAKYEIVTPNYPPLKCSLNENHVSYDVDNDVVDVEKYVSGEMLHSSDNLKDLENRINQSEQSPKLSQPDMEYIGTKNVAEKVIVGDTPRQSRYSRKLSTDSPSSVSITLKETGADLVDDSPKFGGVEEDYAHLAEVSDARELDNASEDRGDMSDRVYTIDTVHNQVSYNNLMEPKASPGVCEDYMAKAKESLNMEDMRDPEIKKLYARLQALEADRESMRQALISMRTDKAQLVLLKEIAQQLCKDISPAGVLPVRKTSNIGSFSFMSIFKWIVSFVCWRKKTYQSRYMSGMSANNVGLLMLLDKRPRVGRWRSLSSTQL